MKTLRAGQIFRGKDYVDMINNAIGTNYASYMRCLVPMDPFVNDSGLNSWFVFMNGDVHGDPPCWYWRNFVSSDGSEIKEVNVGNDIDFLNEKRTKSGFYPFRLAFQLDPYENDVNNCCRFLGLYMLKEFLEEDSIRSIKYVKIADEFNIGSKGCEGFSLFEFDEYAKKDERYLTPIDQLELIDNIKKILLKFDIKTAGRLLDLGIESDEIMATQIRNALLKHFKKQ